MSTARASEQLAFTNADAVLCLLMDIRAGFTLALAKADALPVHDDETGILNRCRQLAENFDWEIDQARRRAGRQGPRPASLHLVK